MVALHLWSLLIIPYYVFFNAKGTSWIKTQEAKVNHGAINFHGQMGEEREG